MNRSENHGAVLLELTIALPILILLFLTSIEYVRALQSQQSMAVLTREAANAAFRDCLELDDMSRCMDVIHENMTTSAGMVLSRSEIMISVYVNEADPKTGAETVVLKAIRPASGETPLGKKSKYTLANFQGPQAAFIQLHQKIAIAEIFYEFQPFISQSFITKDFYDAAIY